MGKNNALSGLLVVVVVLMIALSTFVVISYVTGVLTAAVSFASTDQVAKLQACGITAPPELTKLSTDIPNLLLPAIYVGLPGLLILLSILMFIAGYYHGGKEEQHTSSETISTTSSPDKDGKVEKTRTERSSRSERN